MTPIQSIQLNGQAVAAIGNVHLLNRPKNGLLCPRKCPAEKILEACDRFKIRAADSETTVISGLFAGRKGVPAAAPERAGGHHSLPGP